MRKAIIAGLLTLAGVSAMAKAYHNPSAGRFLSRDPIADPTFRQQKPSMAGGRFLAHDVGPIDADLYGYMQSQPTQKVDPSGLAPVPGPTDMFFLRHYWYGNGADVQLWGVWQERIRSAPDVIKIEQDARARAHAEAKAKGRAFDCGKKDANVVLEHFHFASSASHTSVVSCA